MYNLILQRKKPYGCLEVGGCVLTVTSPVLLIPLSPGSCTWPHTNESTHISAYLNQLCTFPFIHRRSVAVATRPSDRESLWTCVGASSVWEQAGLQCQIITHHITIVPVRAIDRANRRPSTTLLSTSTFSRRMITLRIRCRI